MKTGGNRLAGVLAALLLPGVALFLFYLYLQRSETMAVPLVLLHLLTVLWVVLAFRGRLCRESLLPVGFLASMIGPCLYDAANPGMFQYLGSAVMLLLYAAPWTLATLIAAAVRLALKRRKERSHAPGNEA